MTREAYPRLISYAVNGVDQGNKLEGRPIIINRNILKQVILSQEPDRDIAVYIYKDGEKKRLVEAGFLNYFSESDEGIQLILSGDLFRVKEEIFYEEVLEKFDDTTILSKHKYCYYDGKTDTIIFLFFTEKEGVTPS